MGYHIVTIPKDAIERARCCLQLFSGFCSNNRINERIHNGGLHTNHIVGALLFCCCTSIAVVELIARALGVRKANGGHIKIIVIHPFLM